MSTKTYTQSTLDGMTIDELVEHVRDEFDIEVEKDDLKKSKLVGYILGLQDLREMGLDTTAKSAAKEEETDADLKEDQEEVVRQAQETRVRLIFHSTPEPGGNLPIKMALNGRAYVVKRDAEVELPESVFDACIRNAIQTIYEPVIDPVTRTATHSEARDVARFAYTVLGRTEGRKAA